MTNHILHAGKLLDEKGYLTEAGYATSIVKDYKRDDIKANHLRIKEWDYYLIYNEDYGIALTYADNSYMGLISVSVLDFRLKKEKTTSIITVLPMGNSHMPDSCDRGDILFENKRAKVAFCNNGKRRHIKLTMKQFEKDKDFYADFVLTKQPESDQITIAIPFKKKKQFYYNTKIVGLNVTGHAIVGDTIYSFHEASQAILDWGRGVWPLKNTWYWSAACGMMNGRKIGFNLGYGFGDTSMATENSLFYDGKLHKLEKVTFDIPKDENGNNLYEQPWKMTSSDHRFEMIFTPILDRKAYMNAGILCSNQHQVFGRFNGIMILDDGKEIQLTNFLGFAEEVYNKW